MKKINPIDGVFDTLSAMRDLIVGGPDSVPGRHDVLRDEFDGMIVDTCAAFDTGEWETGVMRKHVDGGRCQIAEQHESREQAEIGHKKWVDLLKANRDADVPKLILWDIPDSDGQASR